MSVITKLGKAEEQSTLSPSRDIQISQDPLKGIEISQIISGAKGDGHSSSIAVTPKDQIIVTWTGRSDAENKEEQKLIYGAISNDHGRTFCEPKAMFNPLDLNNPHNCSSPVLKYLPPREGFPKGEMLLFFRAGSNHRNMTSYIMRAPIDGEWSKPAKLPSGIIGPTKTPPILINGMLVCGSSFEKGEKSEGKEWTTGVRIEISNDFGTTWEQLHDMQIPNRPNNRGAEEPTFVFDDQGNPGILCRDREKDCIWQAFAKKSEKGEWVWPKTLERTSLPNPDSGIASLHFTHEDQDVNVLAFNPTRIKRAPLSLAFSFDGTKTWEAHEAFTLAPEGEFPAIALDTEKNEQHLLVSYAAKKLNAQTHSVFFKKIHIPTCMIGIQNRSVQLLSQNDRSN